MMAASNGWIAAAAAAAVQGPCGRERRLSEKRRASGIVGIDRICSADDQHQHERLPPERSVTREPPPTRGIRTGNR